MATRSIVTHQPEVSCDMCGRRLLRGERPDVFLAAGDRRTVCELCVSRAADEGWRRESEALAAASMLQPRTRRGRSLLDKLRQRREREEQQREHAPGLAAPGEDASLWPAEAQAWESHPRDQDGLEPAYAGASTHASIEAELESEVALGTLEVAEPVAGQAARGRDLEHAIEIFNASECAGRIAGIARALGEPSVTVRGEPDQEDRVRIVVAWELCWYRYEVDLRERPATIGVVADGTELDQLGAEDLTGNASANERGELAPLR